MAAWNYVFTLTLDAGAVPKTDVVSIDIAYGTTDLAAPDAGRMTVVLKNFDNDYTPGAGGTHNSETWMGKRCVLWEYNPAHTYDSRGQPILFDGVITDVTFEVFDTFEAYATITVTDRVGLLAAAGFNIPAATGATLSNVEEWLDEVVSTYSFNNIPDQATVNVVSGSSTATDTGAAAFGLPAAEFQGLGGQLLDTLAITEGGAIACRQGYKPSGHASTAANEIWLRPRGESAFAFAVTFDDTLPANTFPFARVGVSFIGDDLVTRCLFRRLRSLPQNPAITDGTLELAKEYGDRLLERDGLFNATDSNLKELAAWIIGTRARPRLSITEIETVPLVEGDDDATRDLLGISVLDRIAIKFTPPGGSAQLIVTHVVRGVRWRITPTATVGTFDLADVETLAGFIVDTDQVGVDTIT